MHLNIDIHNYYEHLVMDYINKHEDCRYYDEEFLADVCCLALNELPARYIRHEIDMAFYLSSAQRHDMALEVQYAVNNSIKYLRDKQEAEVSD